MSTDVSHFNGPKEISNGSKRNLFVVSIMDLQVMYVCKHMRQEVQVCVTIKLKGLNQRFEESDEGDRQMGFLFSVVITIKYLQLIDMGGLRTTGHRE